MSEQNGKKDGFSVYHGTGYEGLIGDIDLSQAASTGERAVYGQGFYAAIMDQTAESYVPKDHGVIYELSIPGEHFWSYDGDHGPNFLNGFQTVDNEVIEKIARGVEDLGNADGINWANEATVPRQVL